jgi:hypothetical protein
MLGHLFGKSYVEDVGGFDLLLERLQVLWAAACETAETIGVSLTLSSTPRRGQSSPDKSLTASISLDPSDRSLQLIEFDHGLPRARGCKRITSVNISRIGC